MLKAPVQELLRKSNYKKTHQEVANTKTQRLRTPGKPSFWNLDVYFRKKVECCVFYFIFAFGHYFRLDYVYLYLNETDCSAAAVSDI